MHFFPSVTKQNVLLRKMRSLKQISALKIPIYQKSGTKKAIKLFRKIEDNILYQTYFID